MINMLMLVMAMAVPDVPPELEKVRRIIDEHEMLLRRSAGVTKDGEGKPDLVERFVRAEMDPAVTGRAATERMERLGAYQNGVWCFWAGGLKNLLRTLGWAAGPLGHRTMVPVLEGVALHMDELMRDRCGGPGGQQAGNEWLRIASRWTDNTMGNARGQCWPVPAMGITACAPTRAEVPSTQEALIGGALIAAGLGASVLLPADAAAWPELVALVAAP